jgi:membrane protein YqaA with SNARE-associated domain
MSGIGGWAAALRRLALAWGAPGLCLVAFLDSSFLPLPGITDILLIVTVARGSAAMLPVLVAAATLGSIAGCLVMHAIGRKGGQALVQSRFSSASVARATASLQRHGVMAVLIPSLLPPPAPFKIFVLLAGVVGISTRRFAAAIAIGRGARYLALGVLAFKYGARAQTYLLEHGAQASLVAAAALVLGFALYLWRTHDR